MKTKTTKIALTLYTLINLVLVGTPFIFMLDRYGTDWPGYLVHEQGGLIYLGMVAALFLNSYLIIRFTRKD